MAKLTLSFTLLTFLSYTSAYSAEPLVEDRLVRENSLFAGRQHGRRTLRLTFVMIAIPAAEIRLVSARTHHLSMTAIPPKNATIPWGDVLAFKLEARLNDEFRLIALLPDRGISLLDLAWYTGTEHHPLQNQIFTAPSDQQRPVRVPRRDQSMNEGLFGSIPTILRKFSDSYARSNHPNLSLGYPPDIHNSFGGFPRVVLFSLQW